MQKEKSFCVNPRENKKEVSYKGKIKETLFCDIWGLNDRFKIV